MLQKELTIICTHTLDRARALIKFKNRTTTDGNVIRNMQRL